VAIYTAIAFVIAGLRHIGPARRGFVALITGNTAGGITVRRMLVPALIGRSWQGGVIAAVGRFGNVDREAFSLEPPFQCGSLTDLVFDHEYTHRFSLTRRS
jgi:hypothetical protein